MSTELLLVGLCSFISGVSLFACYYAYASMYLKKFEMPSLKLNCFENKPRDTQIPMLEV